MPNYYDFNVQAGGYNMPSTNHQLGELYANFQGMENLEKIMNDAFKKILIANKGLTNSARSGNISMYDYDQQLAEFIRVGIGKQLGIMRNLAMRKARNGMKRNDIGAASGAVYRRSYKDRLGGNINLVGNGKRMSRRNRPWSPGKILKRDHTDRTKQINQYYGPDRAFILRILEMGRDGFMAESGTGAKGRGSKATWGRRGAIAARGFFHTMQPDMEQAAQRLGQDIEKFVERLVNKQ